MLNKELSKVKVTKKNYIEVPIDPNEKVDDSFAHDGWVVVEVKFSSLVKNVSYFDNDNKTDCSVIGSVILEKVDKETLEKQITPRGEDKKIHEEANPFTKNMFMFNKNKIELRKNSANTQNPISDIFDKQPIVNNLKVRNIKPLGSNDKINEVAPKNNLWNSSDSLSKIMYDNTLLTPGNSDEDNDDFDEVDDEKGINLKRVESYASVSKSRYDSPLMNRNARYSFFSTDSPNWKYNYNYSDHSSTSEEEVLEVSLWGYKNLQKDLKHVVIQPFIIK